MIDQCTFCEKNKDEVSILIKKNNDLFICNECVDMLNLELIEHKGKESKIIQLDTDPQIHSLDESRMEIIYEMITALIAADNLLDGAEIREVEKVAPKFLDNFNSHSFDYFFNNLGRKPNFYDCARSLNDLDYKTKNNIRQLLEFIAKGDDDFAHEEKVMLDQLRLIWNLDKD